MPLSILLFAILSADYLFAVAGVGFFDFFPLVWIRVDPVDASAAGQVIGAAAASMGGAVALITLYVNLCEKRFAQEQTLEKDRRIARDQRENERNIAELQRLEEQFNQLSADFAGAELLARVNAGIGLAHIATTHRPGISDTEADARTEQNYPFYRRATNQLAAALHLYKEQPARDEVRKAIRHMGQFDTSEDQPLLHLLLNSLGEANRTAFRTFLDTLAEGKACEPPSFCDTCCLAVRICSDDGKNQQLLKAVVESEGCQALLPLKKHLATLPGNTGKKEAAGAIDGAYLGRLETAWQSLADTRDAIAELLRVRRTPPAMREALAKTENTVGPSEWKELGREIGQASTKDPDLSDCFLQGANLEEAQMQGANLEEAQMQGAFLSRAQMQGANLSRAQMRGAFLSRAQMQGANLFVAEMQGANLREAQMQGAFLSRAQMQGANLTRAQMQGANLREAQMQGANLSWAQMKGADLTRAQMQGADLTGAQMQGANLSRAQMQGADLSRAQMQGADLREAQMQGANLFKAEMQGARLRATNFGQALGKEEWARLTSCELGLPDFRRWDWDPSSEKVRPTDIEDTALIDWLKANFPGESASIPDDAGERFNEYRKWDEAAGVTMWVLGDQAMETSAAESTASEIVDAEPDESDADQ